ncbi:SGNH/GDSL hydrolase family protein [Acaryochloris marina NIES-2412]|uniref:SGNH/GDSL hydrolase family protein n=1 Tax=Acaryochloris marina TaxID=155978 RepID=UPI00405946B2
MYNKNYILLKIYIKEQIINFKRIFWNEILVLGDSHVGVFIHTDIQKNFPGYFFNVVCIGGATVSGFSNPNSKTQALPIFTDSLKNSKAKKILIQLGEVDTGFIIWYRSQKYGTSVTEMLDKAVKNYQDFLKLVSHYSDVVCISTPLPTIRDCQNYGEVANARKNIKATQKERTALTIKFNQLIKQFCLKNKIKYLSLDQYSLGDDGLVKESLYNLDPNNHHYDHNKYASILKMELKGIFI